MKNKIFHLTCIFILLSSLSSLSALPQTKIIPHKLNDEELSLGEYKDEVPELLKGIWQGSDRLLLFSDNSSDFACVLRVFYKWYDDRAAEPPSFAQITTRNRNDATARHGENIEIKYRTLVQDSSNKSGAWELQVKYPSLKEYVYIPVCVINGNLYLNFFIKENFYQEVPSPDNPEETIQKIIPEIYYLKDTGAASGITISPPVIKNELLSYFVDGSSVYHIRYWLSDMELTSEQAEFSDDENEYRVNKFLKTAGRLYTCTTGRSTKIRNIQKSSSLKFEYVLNEESTILATGKPYLVKVPASGNREELQKIVDENNKRKAPPPPPLFPPSEINFHWKEISELEMYNPYTWNRRNLDLHK